MSLVVALAMLAGCRDGGKDAAAPSGPPRSFLMGLSSLPRELNVDAYAKAIKFAGNNADIVLVQRGVPWDDFLPGHQVSDELTRNTASERDSLGHTKARVFFTIDPTDSATGRDRIAGLPADMEGRGFGDDGVRAAFVSYAEYVARNYKPDYLALGVEMNLYYERNKGDFENYRSLVADAYARVKALSPKTQITVTFQYEDLQALLPRDDAHFASWQLVRAFDPDIDFIAISTYPGLAYSSAADIPADYYSQLTAFTDKPIAIAEMGYASSTQGTSAPRTENDQAAFLGRALRDAQDLHMKFAVWYAIWDPVYARDTPFAIFQSIGLLRSDETEKLAWPVWEAAERREYQPVK
jgi:hypothetical protein